MTAACHTKPLAKCGNPFVLDRVITTGLLHFVRNDTLFTLNSEKNPPNGGFLKLGGGRSVWSDRSGKICRPPMKKSRNYDGIASPAAGNDTLFITPLSCHCEGV